MSWKNRVDDEEMTWGVSVDGEEKVNGVRM